MIRWRAFGLALLCVCTAARAVPLSAVASPAGAVTLAWAAPTANANGSTPVTPLASYNVYQGASCTALVKVASVPATQLTYSTPVLAPGSYCFAITALGSDGAEGPKSNTQLATIARPLPTKLVISCPIPKSVGYVICSANAQ